MISSGGPFTMLANTLTRTKFFILFLSFSFLQCNQNIPYTHFSNLWHQIIPLIGNTDITKTQTKEEAFKVYTAQALLLDGKSYRKLDAEMFQTMQSLHLFSYVLPKISSHNLRLGYFSFAKNICQVTDNLDILHTRSAYNTYLFNNPDVAQELDSTLQNLKEIESDFLKTFYAKPPKKISKPTNFIENGFETLETIDKKINSNRFISEFYKRLGQISSLATVYAGLYSIYNIRDFHNDQIKAIKKFWKPVLGEEYAESIASCPTTSVPVTALAIIGSIAIAIGTTKGIKSEFDTSYQRNQSLLLLKKLIKSCQKIVKIVEKNPELEQFLPEYSIIQKFAHYKTHAHLLSEKMVYLIGLLGYYQFNSELSYYISWQGKIHETFLLYEEIHQEFMPLWQALAEIDAQLCTYKLLSNEPDMFCIPQWINQEKPVLDVQGYWHPMISSKKAVTNDMILGASNTGINAIITGANAGGKTTAMTALMLCTILGQSIGIVPAKTYKATPFARMHTYLDITTNLAENESLFMAQANRAKHLYESIKSCNSHQKTFTILDEIFTGTRADFAEKASYEFAQTLAKMPHSMCIIATHFPKLTELEKTTLFVNYQAAAATINDDGSLTYPYLIIPGISTQNIADHILKNKGILIS